MNRYLLDTEIMGIGMARDLDELKLRPGLRGRPSVMVSPDLSCPCARVDARRLPPPHGPRTDQ